MYINSVLSHFGGWQKLTGEHAGEYQELLQIIGSFDFYCSFENGDLRSGSNSSKFDEEKEPPYHRPDEILDYFTDQFSKTGWRPDHPHDRIIIGGGPSTRTRYVEIEALKHGVGVDILFSNYAFAESSIFVKFPIFNQLQRIDLGILIIPMYETIKRLHPEVSSFERIQERLGSLVFLPLKYPLVILGISHKDVKNMKVDEMTSQLDLYLENKTGLSLAEMKIQTERTQFDFKLELPQNHGLAKEICAFANIKGGGLLLVGVDNYGNPVGISKGDLDTLENRILQVNRDLISPNPEIDFDVFELQNDTERCILVVSVREFHQKPCMFKEQVFIRSGPEARAARPHEIRKMILGDEV